MTDDKPTGDVELRLIPFPNPYVQFRATVIGSMMQMYKLLEQIIEEGEDIEDVEFASYLKVFGYFFDDPAFMLAKTGLVGVETYQDACRQFREMIDDPSAIKFEQRLLIVTTFSNELDLMIQDHLEEFHREFDFTIDINDYGAVSIGEYID